MGFLKEFIALTRFEHAVMLAIAVFIGEAITLGAVPPLSALIVLSLLVPIFSEMGSFSLNDFLDIETDKLNKKFDRPLVRGALSPFFALYLSLFSLTLSTALSYFINIYAFVLVLFFNLLAIAYNYKLKDLPLIGNAYIASTMALPFLFGSIVMTNSLYFNTTIIVLALLSFLAGFAREIIKSIQDIGGDRVARKANTLPMLIGERNALYLASFLYLMFIPLTALPFFYGLKFNLAAVGLIIGADVGIVIITVVLLKEMSSGSFKMARDVSLVCLFIGLIAYLIAAVA